jgi:hypothetical protein
MDQRKGNVPSTEKQMADFKTYYKENVIDASANKGDFPK